MSRIREHMFWVAVCRYGSRVIGMMATLLLAGLLTPHDFGLMSGAMIVIGILDLFYDFGLSKEIVYRRERIEEASHTAFVMNFFLGTFMFGLIVAMAPFMGPLLGLQGLTPVLIVAGSALLAASAGRVPAVLMQKEQRFKALVIPYTVATVVETTVAVVAAFMGAGVYALAIRGVVGCTAESLLLIWLSGYRPRLAYDRELAREIIHYAKHLLGANLVAVFVKQAPPTILARLFGSTVLGGYGLATRFAVMPTKEAATVFNRVLFPSFSERRENPKAMRELLLKATRAMMLFGLTTSLVIAWISGPALKFLYGDKWLVAIPLFQLLPFTGLLAGMIGPSGEACKAVGQTKSQLEYSVVVLVMLLIAAIPGALLFGPSGVILGMIFSMLLGFLLMAYRITTYINLSYWRFSQAWLQPLVGGVAATGSVLALRIWDSQMPEHWSLLLEGAVGLAAYALCALATERRFIIDLLRRPSEQRRSETVPVAMTPEQIPMSDLAQSPFDPGPHAGFLPDEER